MHHSDLTLTIGGISATLRPAWGGRMTRLSREGIDWLHPMPDTGPFDPEAWPKGGAYPLIPFHNRIRQGRFDFDGKAHEIPCHPSEPNALHGVASRLAWQGHQTSEDCALMSVDFTPDGRWPFAFRAEQQLKLLPDGLHLDLRLRNTGSHAMPGGLGWHPYIAKCAHTRVQAARDWTLDSGYFPTGDWQDPAPEGPPTRYLSDWRALQLRLSSGPTLRMEATRTLSHLVIHDPEPAYSCVEPVSHLAGALNLPLSRDVDLMRKLLPGEELSAHITLIEAD